MYSRTSFAQCREATSSSIAISRVPFEKPSWKDIFYKCATANTKSSRRIFADEAFSPRDVFVVQAGAARHCIKLSHLDFLHPSYTSHLHLSYTSHLHLSYTSHLHLSYTSHLHLSYTSLLYHVISFLFATLLRLHRRH
jgi:hypothetical protein